MQGRFAPATTRWFTGVFDTPTDAQKRAWPAIAKGDNVLLLAPTGSGKTLAAFLAAIDRLMFGEARRPVSSRASSNRAATRTGKDAIAPRTRVIYISPIKALAVDVERNLMAPLVGIEQAARREGMSAHDVTVAVRTGDTSTKDRRFIAKGNADILITTPESLYLMLTSGARSALAGVEIVIIDEIHALVPNERGAHLMLSIRAA